MNTRVELKEAAYRSGLKVSVVKALLAAGYSFTERLDKAPTWERDNLLKVDRGTS